MQDAMIAHKSILAGTVGGQRFSCSKYSDMMPVLNKDFFFGENHRPASQMKGRRARQVFVVKFSMNETQITMHLEKYNHCKIVVDNLSKDNPP